MLVSSIENGWKIIYQRAHGLLAAQIASHWKFSEPPLYWTETLVAIAEHDDGLAESFTSENLTEAGAPKHFQLMEFSVEQYQNVMEISASKSRWNALLTSMHLEFLYASKRHTNPQLDQFLRQQETLRKQLIKELNITKQTANKSYRLLEWSDALSLLLCMSQIQPEQRRIEISTGPDGTHHQLWQDTKGMLHVDPWPFVDHSFTIEVEYRILTQLSFPSLSAFTTALQKAKVEVDTWTFSQ
ncbi:DUF3891 family protein [Xanthocytophaga flava]|uniref:DUF3891 family protein n=1 Tax=Xanthocytophaga flava TaxID=3048013 RepID=UPI0028D164B4|nr:DUF3891 family protein [Xanthocytophaga flavus]MDJ1470415.1 DUF3891 family protein [Xanthocytophaga flavus]